MEITIPVKPRQKKLTPSPRELQTLNFIKDRALQEVPTNYADVATELGVSKSTACCYMRALINKGLMTKNDDYITIYLPDGNK